MINQTKPRLVCYDIADPKRLQRVYKIAKEYGTPIQYSVSLAMLNDRQLETLLNDFRETINHRADDVRIYTLSQPAWLVRMGNTTLPEGVFVANELLTQWLQREETQKCD